MDGITETPGSKKWFVYLGDHHEGPFSVEDLQSKMSAGALNRESYAWAEGMGDWQMLTDIQELSPLFTIGAGSGGGPQAEMITLDSPPEQQTMMAAAPVAQVAEVAVSLPSLSPTPSPSLSPAPSHSAQIYHAEKTGDLSPSDLKQARAVGGRPKVNPVLVKLLFGTIFAGGIGMSFVQGHFDPLLQSPALKAAWTTMSETTRPYLMIAVDKVPMLGDIISPIPSLDDVSPEEHLELQLAAKAKAETTGLKAAVALSKLDPLAPSFYVASNLPDGAKFEIHVIGVPDTLLNQLGFSSNSLAVISRRLGKSGVIRFNDGKPVPRGEYLVFLTASLEQPPQAKAQVEAIAPAQARNLPEHLKDRKILSFRQYFLGGARDASYTNRLKEFHDRLRAKANTELTEAKQFAMTLESQLSSTSTKFATLRKGKLSAKQRKAWADFHNQWMQLQGQMDQVFLKWTPESLANEYFYGALYDLTRQVGQSVARVHGFHHGFFTGSNDPKSFDIQLGEALSQAQNALSILKTKIDQAEKLPPTPNGMPRRDGI